MMQRYLGWRAATLAMGCTLAALLATAPARAQECVGDCNGDGMVAINELIIGVNIALGSQPITACESYDVNGDGMVTINELITAVNNALNGCPAVNTPTNTVPVDTPTNTVPPIDTPTHTPTLPAGTATATITNTPEQESTPTPTATEAPNNNLGAHVCDLGQGSQLFLQTAALPLALPATGTFEIDCGAPGADGTAECFCTLQQFDPVIIPSIGDVCVNPASGCEAGSIDCDGGTALDVDLNANHNIGTCTSNADCAESCDAHCASLGAGFARQNYGCEGYCQGGSADEMECNRDSECPGGQCPGGEPVAHFDTCNCVCSGTRIGDASAAGGLSCNLGTQINVELPTNGVCGDPATIQLAPVCGAVSSETSTGVIIRANNSPTATLPATGPESVNGAPVSCESFKAGNITGLKLVGQLGFFDSTLGDIRSRNTFVCQ
ncbi:hypothetical protein KF840_16645 [bacterium]|nr:hypothetical protein [bacterium]